MQDEIFNLLMLILMLENGGGTGNINQLILMFLMLNSRENSGSRGLSLSSPCGNGNCCRDDGFTF